MLPRDTLRRGLLLRNPNQGAGHGTQPVGFIDTDVDLDAVSIGAKYLRHIIFDVLYARHTGGGEESRTPVRNAIHDGFYMLIWFNNVSCPP